MSDRKIQDLTLNQKVRLIAFFLPQFHPIPENDTWWGEGFTEWVNVSKAKPLYPNHYQPHLPTELGYYDLRDQGVRQSQAVLAQEYGVYGFCYYHYWFTGRRLLERPFDEVLASGKPDFPFCLCWANENWTRTWDGGRKDILMEQQYSEQDDLQHIHWLIKAFKDHRYIRVDGKPLFLVYRVSQMPNPKKTTEIWREEAQKNGLEDLYLCTVESFPIEHGDPSERGFDAAVEFQPDWANLPLHRKIVRRLSEEIGFRYCDIYDYASFSKRMIRKTTPAYKRFPCVTPAWDNTARKRNQTTILDGSTPDFYQSWLEATVSKLSIETNDENLVFVNAWNEWGEGNHLEPCEKWGRGYLEATRKVLMSNS